MWGVVGRLKLVFSGRIRRGEAGFTLAAASEINANPKDTRNHPFGVWTLPPVRRSAPPGQPADPAFDHSKYDAIGESDRMTLKFVKPAAAPA